MDRLDIDRLDHDTAAAMLLWQVDLGVNEALLDAPLNRYELAEPVRAAASRGCAEMGRASRRARA